MKTFNYQMGRSKPFKSDEWFSSQIGWSEPFKSDEQIQLSNGTKGTF